MFTKILKDTKYSLFDYSGNEYNDILKERSEFIMIDDFISWDVFGPIFLILYTANLVWSIYSIRNKSILNIVIASLISGAISYIFAWSIGTFMLVIAVIQLLAAAFIWFNNKRVMNKG